MHFKLPQLTPEAIVANAKKKFIVYLMVWESKVAISVIECIGAGHLVWSARTKCKSLWISMRIFYPLTIQSQDDYLQRTTGNDTLRTHFGCGTVLRNFSGMRAQRRTSSVVMCTPPTDVLCVLMEQERGVGQRWDIKRHDRDGGDEWRSCLQLQQMICGCNEADELGKLVHVVGSAHSRIYVVG
jgi:hypothetical protein